MGAKTTLLAGADFVTFTGTRSSMLTPAFLRMFPSSRTIPVPVSSGYPGRRRAAVFFFPAMERTSPACHPAL